MFLITHLGIDISPISDTELRGAGPFPGVYFSGQPGAHNPWQPPVPHNMQKNLSEAIHSFNNAPSSSFGQSTSQGTSPQPQSQGLQFGAFGAPNFPQFGQLTSDFGQSPFIRTGKAKLPSTSISLPRDSARYQHANDFLLPTPEQIIWQRFPPCTTYSNCFAASAGRGCKA